MSSKKTEIIKKLADNYPNFLRKDLSRIFDIFITEIRNSLKRHERVELRNVFTIEPRIRKARIARNPKTAEKIYVKEKRSIIFKSSKTWSDKINE